MPRISFAMAEDIHPATEFPLCKLPDRLAVFHLQARQPIEQATDRRAGDYAACPGASRKPRWLA
jgi:hypothetical protein